MSAYLCPCSGTEYLTIWEGPLYKSGLDRNFEVVACQRCGLVSFLDPPTEAETTHTLEDRGWDATHLPKPRRFLWPTVRQAGHVRLAALVGQCVPKGGALLDIGCGEGLLGERLLAAGYRVTGVEPGPQVGREAARRGLEVIPSKVEDWDPGDRRFQGVILSHCLEHIPDPLTILRRVADLLSEDGQVFIDVPNAERPSPSARRAFAPQHLWYFSPASLRHLLGLAGLEVVRERVFALDCFQVVARHLPAGKAPAAPDPTAAARALACLKRHRWLYYASLQVATRKIPLLREFLVYGRCDDRRYDTP